MPIEQGKFLKALNITLNKKLKNEIRDLVNNIKQVSSLKRISDTIFQTEHYHLDVRKSDEDKNSFKVDIQFKKLTTKKMSGYSLKTVAVVLLDKDTPQTSLDDLKEALTLSSENHHLYKVT